VTEAMRRHGENLDAICLGLSKKYRI